MAAFANKVLMVGYGGVAQCALPILAKLIKMPLENITVMDFEDKAADLKPWIARGVKWVRGRVTKANLGRLLGKYLERGDLLIDLAWNIECTEILQWCHDRGVLYINTSVELWDPYAGAARQHPTTRTLYWRHMRIRAMKKTWTTPGPTAVLEHGANPGLISHWTKQGLVDIAERVLEKKMVKRPALTRIKESLEAGTYNELAMNLGVKVIHCSERDTQISDQPKQVGEFVNTWSVEGFREEGTTTAEMGWGTHEKALPALAYRHKSGPQNQICLARMGINTWVRSWVPNYEIHGMVVRHGEAFTISDHLTVRKKGRTVYRPTVHYAYCPCDAAIVSLNEMAAEGYRLQPKIRIMDDEITSGADILGSFLMGHPCNAWWVGSDLSIEQCRKLVPHQNATTMQVAISVVAAVSWMIENPERGVVVPDDLPHEYILKISRPYLGRNLSVQSDWNPLKVQPDVFSGISKPDLDRRDPWQFKNFLVTD